MSEIPIYLIRSESTMPSSDFHPSEISFPLIPMHWRVCTLSYRVLQDILPYISDVTAAAATNTTLTQLYCHKQSQNASETASQDLIYLHMDLPLTKTHFVEDQLLKNISLISSRTPFASEIATVAFLWRHISYCIVHVFCHSWRLTFRPVFPFNI